MTNPTPTATAVTRTRRHLTALDGIYRRIDRGDTNGRNAASTATSIERHWLLLQAALEEGGYEDLDARPRLAAMYRRIERRHYGVSA